MIGLILSIPYGKRTNLSQRYESFRLLEKLLERLLVKGVFLKLPLSLVEIGDGPRDSDRGAIAEYPGQAITCIGVL